MQYFSLIQFGGNMWVSPKGQAAVIQSVFTIYLGPAAVVRITPFKQALVWTAADGGLFPVGCRWHGCFLALSFLVVYCHIWPHFIRLFCFTLFSGCFLSVLFCSFFLYIGISQNHAHGVAKFYASTCIHILALAQTDTHTHTQWEEEDREKQRQAVHSVP